MSTPAPSACNPGAPERVRTNLIGLSQGALECYFEAMGERAFRARQVMKWLHHRGVTDFRAMTDLSKVLRDRLADQACAELPTIAQAQSSTDGTRKWLLRLVDGNAIEMVFIPDGDRGTLCISSQVGCTLNCQFCSTARQGFNRNLTAAEIVGQVFLARRALEADRFGTEPSRDSAERVITNVVFMGMGEPLYNFDEVVTACNLIMEDLGYGIGKRRVTLSTAGVVPMMDRLRTATDVSLALSLHAPDNALRDRLVPLNRKYPVEQVLEACRRFVADAPARRVTFEYVMLDGVNDSDDHARALVRRLSDVPAKVNLIPFNPFPGSGFKRSPQATIDRFRDILLGKGITTITRRTRGEDIDAACGQLVGQVADRGRRQAYFDRLARQRDHNELKAGSDG